MNPELRQALAAYLTGLADDELLLGHRNSEWCGHAPIIEEDIAFANLALDEIGHAAAWYTLAADLLEKDRERYPDELVYFREPGEYRNLQLVELPRGDWALSVLRQFLFDALERVRLARLSSSSYEPAAEAAVKMAKEEIYHYRHSLAWVRRLGSGTEESRRRMQNALNELWPYSQQAFIQSEEEQDLARQNLVPEASRLKQEWEELVLPVLEESGLSLPQSTPVVADRKEHSAHLKVLLSELQSLARSEPEARW
jgi:ring-1,2-phenylacetyl-CoA epoxidase subunit PaaC